MSLLNPKKKQGAMQSCMLNTWRDTAATTEGEAVSSALHVYCYEPSCAHLAAGPQQQQVPAVPAPAVVTHCCGRTAVTQGGAAAGVAGPAAAALHLLLPTARWHSG